MITTITTPEANLGQVQAFHDAAIVEYGKVTIGEEYAKLAIVLALATGGNVALLGIPGGNKTELGEASHRVIKGADNVAVIPNQADLKPERVVGGHVKISRRTNGHVEDISTTIEGVIQPDVHKIEIDEASRINPLALGTTLELMRRRRMMTTAGPLVLKNLIIVSATLNPSETRQATFQIADAFASRFPNAAVMGVRDRAISKEIMGGMEPDPDSIEPVLDLYGLQSVRAYIAGKNTAMDPEMQSHGIDLIERMTDSLAKEFNYHEADGRMTMQLRKNAIALAALRGRQTVSQEDVDTAAMFIYTARVGMSALRGSALNVNDIAGATSKLLKSN